MKVICFGDSNTYGFDPRSFFGSRYSAENRWTNILAAQTGWTVYNQGINGREIPREHIMFDTDIDLLIVMLGTNDLLQGRTSHETTLRMERFLEINSFSRLLLIAPPPLQPGEWVSERRIIDESVKLAKLYRELSDKYKVSFADAGEWNVEVLFDGVHFSEKGHHAFAKGLFDYLMRAELTERE